MITCRLVEAILKLPELQYLSIRRLHYLGTSLAKLESHPVLERFLLQCNEFTAEALQSVLGLPQLFYLQASGVVYRDELQVCNSSIVQRAFHFRPRMTSQSWQHLFLELLNESSTRASNSFSLAALLISILLAGMWASLRSPGKMRTWVSNSKEGKFRRDGGCSYISRKCCKSQYWL